MSNHAYPIVRTTTAGKTHYLRTNETNNLASTTLCNANRNDQPTLDIPGLQVTCKRCLKIAALNENPKTVIEEPPFVSNVWPV